MASLRPTLKRWLRYASNRLQFPRARIGESSYVSASCHLDSKVTIGRECRVFGARLGPQTRLDDEVIVGHQSKLMHTTVGRGCIIEQEAELYHCTLADHVKIYTKSVLTEVQVGRYSYASREAYMNKVAIGSFCSIGPRVYLGGGEHPADLVTTAPVFYSTREQCGASFAFRDQVVERKPITIGHDVWVGAHVFVRDGVTLEDGALVAAGAVVVADVPAYAVVGGVPAKVIRYRYPDDIIRKLRELQWWNWDESRLRAAQPWLAQPDIMAFLRWAES